MVVVAGGAAVVVGGGGGKTRVSVIGVGSNLLVRDGGIKGVVIRLMRGFTGITVEGNEVVAGAGAPDLNVALTAREHSLAGLEFLSGIPGTIGGAFPTNAGAYGGELVDVLISAEIIDRSGVKRTIPSDRMGLSYRHSEVDPGWIFVAARFRGEPGERGRNSVNGEELPAKASGTLDTGDRLRIETPGGGGRGEH